MVITLLLLNFCHWAGDYSHFSTPWMLNAKKLGKPLTPILAHAGVHALLFFVCVSMLYDLNAGLLAFAIQLPTHFIIDVWKGRMNGWFEDLQNPANKFHWWIFHYLVLVIYFIC